MSNRLTRLLAFPAVCAVLCAMADAPVAAQSYPTRTVRIVVPFAPGGPADTLGRVLADKLSQFWSQPVVIDNRGGAGGNIGADLVARAPPDGYTLFVNPSNHVINASLYEKLSYDPIRDFTPITEIASYMLVLVVHPSVPVSTLTEFVAFAKAKPGGLPVANASTGTPTHLTAALFGQMAGVEFVHVPYKGAAPANSDLLGGQVLAMFNNPINALPQIRAKALRAIAVTGAKRLSLMPELPTVAEEGYPGFEATTWFGLFGPANLPPEVVAKVNADVVRALDLPDVREKLGAQGFKVAGNSPQEFAAFVRTELDKWSKVVRAANLKVE